MLTLQNKKDLNFRRYKNCPLNPKQIKEIIKQWQKSVNQKTDNNRKIN